MCNNVQEFFYDDSFEDYVPIKPKLNFEKFAILNSGGRIYSREAVEEEFRRFTEQQQIFLREMVRVHITNQLDEHGRTIQA